MNQAEKLLAILPPFVINELSQFGLRLSHSSEVIRLSHGLSNVNYLINDGEHQWVLRSNSSASDTLCDRHAEVKNWRLAADAGLAPSLYYVSPDHAYFLSEYIEQDHGSQWADLLCANSVKPLIDVALIKPNAGRQLLVLLQGLARLAVPDNVIEVSTQWQRYRDQLRHVDTHSLGTKSSEILKQWQDHLNELLGLEGKIGQWLAELGECILASQYSHRDLNPHNLLSKKGQVFCIDFEYACGSHPLFDLAGVLSTHVLSTAQREALIEAYLLNHPKLTADAKYALPAAINMHWIFAVCWSLLMAADHAFSCEEQANDIEKSHNSHKAQEYLDYFELFFVLID